MNHLLNLKNLLKLKPLNFLLRHQFITALIVEYVLSRYLSKILKAKYPGQKKQVDAINSAVVTLLNLLMVLKKGKR